MVLSGKKYHREGILPFFAISDLKDGNCLRVGDKVRFTTKHDLKMKSKKRAENVVGAWWDTDLENEKKIVDRGSRSRRRSRSRSSRSFRRSRSRSRRSRSRRRTRRSPSKPKQTAEELAEIKKEKMRVKRRRKQARYRARAKEAQMAEKHMKALDI